MIILKMILIKKRNTLKVICLKSMKKVYRGVPYYYISTWIKCNEKWQFYYLTIFYHTGYNFFNNFFDYFLKLLTYFNKFYKVFTLI